MTMLLPFLALLLALAAIPTNAADVQKAAPSPLSVSELAASNDFVLTESFPLETPPNIKQAVHVYIYHRADSKHARLVKRDSPPPSKKDPFQNLTRVDMTPAKCTSRVCFPGSLQGPRKNDCDAVIAAQKFRSYGSLTAFPGTYVVVLADTCGVVFQNPNGDSRYALDFNWAMLGSVGEDLEEKCFRPEEMSTGGACEFKHYEGYNFTNVLISLQSVDPQKPPFHKIPP